MGKQVKPSSLKNLKIFEKGNPGGGRPKGVPSCTTILKRFLEAKLKVEKHPITGKPAKITAQEQIMLAVIAKAMKGEIAHAKEIWERIDGKIAQSITGLNEQAIKHEITVVSSPIDISIRELAEKIVKQ